MSPILSIAFALLVAQVPAPGGQGETPASREPRSAPGAGQEFLGRFEGDWAVAKAFFPREGEPIRASGRCHQEMINDGRFLRSDFTFGATNGLGLIGFEPESGLFTSVWIDSRQTRMSMRRSREPFDGDRIVLESRSLDEGSGDSRSTRTVTQLEEDGRVIVHRQYLLDPSGEERLMMELVMTRDDDGEAR